MVSGVEPQRRWTRRVAVLIAVLLAGGIVFGQANWQNVRSGKDVVIEFHDTLAHERVYPLLEPTDLVRRPRLIDLRFPHGRTFRSDDADVAYVDRGIHIRPDLIDSIETMSGDLSSDEIAEYGRRMQNDWGLQPPGAIDRWLAEGRWDMVLQRELPDTHIDGRNLHVSVEIRRNISKRSCSCFYTYTTFAWLESSTERDAEAAERQQRRAAGSEPLAPTTR
jgi:hypothetical protein